VTDWVGAFSPEKVRRAIELIVDLMRVRPEIDEICVTRGDVTAAITVRTASDPPSSPTLLTEIPPRVFDQAERILRELTGPGDELRLPRVPVPTEVKAIAERMKSSGALSEAEVQNILDSGSAPRTPPLIRVTYEMGGQIIRLTRLDR
jgi:hypothetical protein